MEEPTATESPEHAAYRAEVRAWLSANATPRKEVSPWALNFHTSYEDARREFEKGRAWQKTCYGAGYAGFTYPVEYGGQGKPAWTEAIFKDEVANFDVSSGFISSTIAMLGPTLAKHGTEEQKRTLLPRLLSGEDAYCQLFSEPGAGSDLAGLGCKAVLDGDEFVVTGQKVWNSAAQFCSRGMLLVRTNPDAPKHKGITFLLVDMDSPGIEVRPLVQPNGASHFNEVFLEEVRVPAANVLGAVNEGWGPARTVLSNESAFIGGAGTSISTYQKLVMLAQQQGVTGDPVVRQELMVAFTREKLLAWMGERIMTAVRRREVPPVDPSILKLFVAGNKVQSGNLAMAMSGAAGMAGGAEQTLWAQNELITRYGISIGGGTNEVQRNNLAERALGLPREPGFDPNQSWKDIPRN